MTPSEDRYAGQPGEPGEPGEPGKGGGGAGGHGGGGGQGGRGRGPGESHDTRLVVVVGFFLLIALALSTATFFIAESQADLNAKQDKVIGRQAQILANQVAALTAARRAEYRICLRQMVNRADINLDKASDEIHLPLYDCTPDLVGQQIRRLSLKDATAFERYVDRTPQNRLP